MTFPSQLQPLPHLTGRAAIPILPQVIPTTLVEQILQDLGKTSQRRRALPHDFLVYYIITLGLFRQDACREVLRLVQEDLREVFELAVQDDVPGKAAITQARTDLGSQVMQTLFERLVVPRATPQTPGAYYRHWRTVSLDGTTLTVPNSVSNAAKFGHSGSKEGPSAFPLAHLVTLAETGTHIIFRAAIGAWREGETTLARPLLTALTPEMLLLADRAYYGHECWQTALDTGAALVWRVQKSLRLPVEELLPDGSYLSTTVPPKGVAQGHRVRVIVYQLAGSTEIYRLITNILDPTLAPALELAALYHERWEHEGILGEVKTDLLGGANKRLRSESADLVYQEIYGLLLAHYAVRYAMHEAALEADTDPDRLSFIHAVRVMRRKLPQLAALPPSAVVPLVGERSDRHPAGAGLLQPWAECPAGRATTHQSVSHTPCRTHRRASR